ncbi:MAG: xanthine dehydrogenase family protein subunit M [Anaerolineales bacterium]|nr:xanthine dehydrogenase family protein subunit M [Anaerolineales bacterium]
MYSANFDYVRAESIDQAVELLSTHPHARLLAGGHSLIPALKFRLENPELLIDIGRLEDLKGITSTTSRVNIGALTTHAEIAASDALPAGLRDAASMVGDPQVRNWGTIGGNISHADPASDLPTILVALGAKIMLTDMKGSRIVPAASFFEGFFETAKNKDELVLSIEVPNTGISAYEKMPNPASGYCMVGAGVMLKVENGVCSSASVAVGGLTPGPRRCPSVEAALVGKALDADTLSAAAKAVENDLGDDLLGDMHASEEYRKAMASVYMKRALMKAAARA